VPGTSQFVNSNIFSHFHSLSEGISFLFFSPAAFQLWFLRDLILIVAFSPLVYFLVSKLKWAALLIVFLCSPYLYGAGWVYFVLGGLVCQETSLDFLNRKINIYHFTLCTLAYVGNAILVTKFPTDYHFNNYYNILVNICALLVIWKGYDYVAKGRVLTKYKLWHHVVGYSFFIYLFHEPAFNIIKKLGLKICGVNELSLIILYLVNPLIMCAIAIAVAKLLQKFLPKLYSIAVGGR